MTKEEIYKMAENQLKAIRNESGQDNFYVDMILRHMNFIFQTELTLFADKG